MRSIRTWSWNHSRCRSVGAAQSGVHGRGGRAVPRQRQCVRRARSPRRASNPLMPPQRVTSAWRQSTRAEQVPEVGRHVCVLAGRDARAARARARSRARRGRRSSPAPRTTSRPTRARTASPSASACFGRERAVRVDVQLGVVADRLAGGVETLRIAPRLAAELHLHARDAAPRPSRRAARAAGSSEYEREAAAAVDRDGLVRSRQEVCERARPEDAPSDPRARCRPRTRPTWRCPDGPRSEGDCTAAHAVDTGAMAFEPWTIGRSSASISAAIAVGPYV